MAVTLDCKPVQPKINFFKVELMLLLLLAGIFQCVFASQSSVELPTVAAIEERIEQVKTDPSLDETHKSQKIAQLQLTIKRRDAAMEQKRQALNYTESLANAASQQSALEKKIAALKPTPLTTSVTRAPLVKLEALVTKNDAELATLRKQLTQVTTDIKNEKAFDIQVALDEARQALQLQSVEPKDTQADDISRMSQQLNIYFQQTQIENLEQRLLSRNARLSLWETQQRWLSKQLTILETRLGQIRALVTNHRQSDVNQIMKRATEFQESLEGQPARLRELARKNIVLAEELNKLVNDQDEVINQKESATLGAQKIQQKFTSLTEQLAITQLGSSPEFGAALRKQRDQITDESRARRSLQLQKQALTRSRLAQFRIDAMREITATAELDQIMNDLVAESSEPITEEQTRIAQNLLTTRDSILEKLSTAYWNYISNLTSLTLQSDSFIELNKHYADLLDQQLLWMPSSPVVGANSVSDLRSSINFIIYSKTWGSLTFSVITRLKNNAAIAGFILLILVLLVIRRQSMIELLSKMKDRVGKVNRDKISLTLVALVVTFLLALPGPLMLFSIGFLFDDNNAFSNSLIDVISYGSMIYLVLSFAYQSARNEGLLILHLKRSQATVNALRKNLSWFMIVIIPAIMLNKIIEESAAVEIRDSLGRIVFMFETFAMATFVSLVFPIARTNQKNASTNESQNISEWLYGYLRFTLIILVPLFLVGTSIYGYHYSAVQIENHLINSALVILAGNLAFYLSLRAFAINERQLALEKLRAKRAAAAAAKALSEEEGDAEDIAPTANDLQEIDLQTISKQTHTLLKLVFTVVVGIALWRVWSEIFPAFKPLVNVELWSVLEMSDGIPTNVSITLWDLLLSLGSLVITYLATRNISGLLDVALLNRVSLQPGSSYAIATVAQYAIVIIGTVIALQGLGAQWAKLQWLIAALSVGLGFGLQEMVANFVSGIVILFERPFRIGDTVTVGEQWGTVTKIRMRATTIIDWDRREIIVPNKTFIQERLTNWTLTDTITRRKIDVGVAYGSDVNLVEKILLDIAYQNSKVQDEPAPEAYFVSFGESSINFCLRIFVKGHREHASVAHEIHKAIDREFRANGIEIAFPQRDIHLDAKPITVNLVKDKPDKI